MTHVIPWTGRRGNMKVQGDLCQKCWDELMQIFRPSPTSKGRHQIVLTDPNSIR